MQNLALEPPNGTWSIACRRPGNFSAIAAAAMLASTLLKSWECRRYRFFIYTDLKRWNMYETRDAVSIHRARHSKHNNEDECHNEVLFWNFWRHYITELQLTIVRFDADCVCWCQFNFSVPTPRATVWLLCVEGSYWVLGSFGPERWQGTVSGVMSYLKCWFWWYS